MNGLLATADMGILTGVLGILTLRRTVQVRPGPSLPRVRGIARVHAHLQGLVTTIHEISELGDHLFQP